MRRTLSKAEALAHIAADGPRDDGISEDLVVLDYVVFEEDIVTKEVTVSVTKKGRKAAREEL